MAVLLEEIERKDWTKLMEEINEHYLNSYQLSPALCSYLPNSIFVAVGYVYGENFLSIIFYKRL